MMNNTENVDFTLFEIIQAVASDPTLFNSPEEAMLMQVGLMSVLVLAM